AEDLAHPLSLACALHMAALVHQYRRDRQAVYARAERAITLATEKGFPHWLALGTVLLGWVLLEQGRHAEGIHQMQRGLAAYQSTGSKVSALYYLGLLAEAHGCVRQIEVGLRVLVEALATAHRTGERLFEAELCRLKGALLLALSVEKHTEAETCFHQAL